jgi:SecD/SecF fusion protein
MNDRRRNAFVLALVLGLAVISLIIIVGIPGVTKAKKTHLGLDLKGGVQLTFQGQPTPQSQVNSTSIGRAINVIQSRVNQLGVAEPLINQVGSDEISVDLPGASNIAEAEKQVGQVAQLYFYDWEANVIGPSGQPEPTNQQATGGQAAGTSTYGIPLYEAVLRGAGRKPIPRKQRSTAITGSWYEVLDSKKKVLFPQNTGQGYDTQAELQSAIESAPGGVKALPKGARAVQVPTGTVILQALSSSGGQASPTLNSYYVLDDNPVLSGKDISNPQEAPDQNNAPSVQFGFNGSAGSKFESVTKTIAQRGANASLPGQQNFQHFAVALDGRLITVPSIDFTQFPDGLSSAGGNEITGGFTIDSATSLANLLATGALPIKLALISSEQVSATLGKQALNQGLVAGLVGLIAVALFLIVFYRVLGLIAVGALALYALYLFALVKVIPVTLTLPGIAGFVLTIGVAADANIVIFERVKEEVRNGRSMPSAIATGYKRGFASIVDANVVTFMTAFILFMLATSDVKGFAFMLGLGVLVSLFTAVAATQAILGTLGRTRVLSSPSALGAREDETHRGWRFDFMGRSKWFFTLSGTILLIGALAIGGRGLNLGIDFVSGTQIKASFVKPATESEIRSVLAAAGVKNSQDAQIQRVSSKGLGTNAFQISTKTLHPGEVNAVVSDLGQQFGGLKNRQVQSIGPTFGKTVANSAIIAIIASLLVISIYIALRFEWKYAVPVLIALMHDLLITAGVYSLTGRVVTTSTVAALLTILGYSLYDTIIVFDRIRENVPRMPRAAFSQIVNRSMSEVLTRSLATSLCTLLPVLALLLFGGDTLKDFAFALMIGIASGAYSSIFIASPVLMHSKERETIYARRHARIAAANGGVVPAYAVVTAEEEREAQQASESKGRRRRKSVTAPERPDGQLSREEFDDLVRDIEPDVEQQPAATPPARRSPSADLTPEEVVMPSEQKPAGASKSRSRNRRHGRK